MPAHAFVDESKVRGFHLVAAIVEPRDLAPARASMRRLLLPNQRRLHFTKERSARQRQIRDVLTGLPIEAWVYAAPAGRQERTARASAISALVTDLASRSAHRLVLEHDDSLVRKDREVLYRATRRQRVEELLAYEHLLPHQEPLLWVPDAVAWCWTAGGGWREAVAPLVTKLRAV